MSARARYDEYVCLFHRRAFLLYQVSNKQNLPAMSMAVDDIMSISMSRARAGARACRPRAAPRSRAPLMVSSF